MQKIITRHVFPPIPDRRNDWCAYRDGEEERGNYGWGRTEAKAVADLINNVEASPDVFTAWAGGTAPVAGVKIECVLREYGNPLVEDADELVWSHDGGIDDILAYRVIQTVSN